MMLQYPTTKLGPPTIVPCIKCGWDRHHVRYVATRLPDEIWLKSDADKMEREHLRICCARCGYTWNADCLAVPTESATE